MSFKTSVQKFPLYNSLVIPFHFVQAFRAASRHDYPAAAMKVIGVTGTNGKTTTCWLIYEMLKTAGKKVGIMSTIGFAKWDSPEIFTQTAHMTTETPENLNKNLAKLRDAGCEYLVLEVASHALSQHRIFGIPIDIAVFTNLSREHLDYHKTMKNYRLAKEKLFKITQRTRGGRKIGIVNFEDDVAKFFARDIEFPLSFGTSENADLRARQMKISVDSTEYFLKISPELTGRIIAQIDSRIQFSTKKSRAVFAQNLRAISREKLHIKTKIGGESSVFNSLAAVGVGLSYGLTREDIERGIFALESVSGRLESINEGQNFRVIIDFAHTPDAYAKLLPPLKNLAKKSPQTSRNSRRQIITLFGLAGARDQDKAFDMGRIAAENSDFVVLTEDDPRGDPRTQSEKLAKGAENQGKIRAQDLDKNLATLLQNPSKIREKYNPPTAIDDSRENLFLIDDRASAIKFAFSLAQASDTVILMGKGHETTIARKDSDDPWNESATARKILRDLAKK